MKNHLRLMTFFLSGLVFLGGFNALGADNSEEDLEEATGLVDENQMSNVTSPSDETTAFDSQNSWLNSGRTRTYLLIDSTQSTGGADEQAYFPNGQLSFFGAGCGAFAHHHAGPAVCQRVDTGNQRRDAAVATERTLGKSLGISSERWAV